jgi:hypothetical protein
MKIRKAIAEDASRIVWLNKEVQTIHVRKKVSVERSLTA